ncbi:MAG: bifunctional diaminohydroxyphosphoribosylaminopyrimidine deaminase/5-amino-6-(5-phosphoribosylamino)uracil reductase RibD, partial [Planctomycetales bacterium]|nr:bifunctional diaminohydroxyphosphoribosylaminopyrimidine deaminase/5-amino-6-(5-phosphoribosylamino)uracil reductase RibD [Planctomycetales bacterium]
VTLEPCCHTGKTPPCTQAAINANVRRVVIRTLDPSDKVAGKGVSQLREAGIEVVVGVCESEAQRLLAPFAKLVTVGQPWAIAKWAMTLDGKIATHTKDSRWISNVKSREIVHEIRGRVDGVIVGSGTALADDPLLMARPEGKRVATRIVVDSAASLATSSKLAMTAKEIPVLIAVGPNADAAKCEQLQTLGCEIIVCDAPDHGQRLHQLFDELGRRDMTNVLCEGGSRLLGNLFDQRMIDEACVFVAPKIVGGSGALTPIGGIGADLIANCCQLKEVSIETIDCDVYVRGFVDYETDC